jgi:hypothetical protein
MKVGSPANYYVRVSSAGWDVPAEEANLHRGSYAVSLNFGPEIAFIDDLSRLGPPWRESTLPPEEEGELRDPDMVRLLALLHSRYTVTPNAALAGQTERFTLPWGFEDQPEGVVFYTSPAEFAILLDDLVELADSEAGNIHSTVRRDKVLDHPVIQIIENRVLPSPWLHPRDARTAGLPQRSDSTPPGEARG